MSKHRLTERQLEVLRAVATAEGSLTRDIVRRVGLHWSKTVPRLDALGEKGLIRRRFGWRLTPEGRDALAKLGGVR